MRRETPDAEGMIKRVRRWVTVSGLHRQEKGQQKAQGRRDHLFGLAIRPFHVVMLSISCYWRKKMTRQLTSAHGIAGRAQGLSGVRTRRAGYTVGTSAIQEDLMPSRLESFWKFRHCRRHTSLKVKNLATGIALEVVMMFLACHLVAGCLAGNLYRLQPAFGDQCLDVSINGRDSEGWVTQLRTLPDFFCGERSISFCECLPNGRFLPCLSLIHGRKMPPND
jgi:hypothetical protein